MAAAVTAIAVVFTTGAVVWDVYGPNPPRGIASTPLPLAVTPSADTRPAAVVLAEIADRAETSGVPAGTPSGTDHLVLHAWYLHSQVDDGNDPHGTVSALQATWIEQWIREDGSGRQVQIDAPAEFESPEDRARWVSDADGGRHETTYAPGERLHQWSDRPPLDPVALKDWLTTGHRSANDPEFVLSRITDLVRDRALTGPERAAVLRVLAALPDVRFAGEARDRAGRPGLAFTVRSLIGLPSLDTIVIDPGDGRVLSHEEMLTDTPGRLNVRIPAVISYENYLESDFAPQT